MAIITLTSDWGLKDHYLAVIKGKILSLLPGATIVDISHNIPPFNSMQAAFILKNSYKNFPEGTIHIIAVNTEETTKYPHTMVMAGNHYFIGTDNGIFSLILEEPPQKIVEITIPQDSDYFTFSTRDRFIKAAVHLANDKKPEELGQTKGSLVEKLSFQPVTDNNTIKGMVIYIDNYENVITNISQSFFNEFSHGRKFSIVLRSEILRSVSHSYTDVPFGEIVALFNTSGFLEIAINQGNASSLLGLYQNDTVRIEFVD